eukprot:m.265293 g.265293  ORF g.265293 m.265293 type:complete len:50 (+) comp40485_c0_seq25:456-605(+)
MQCLQTDLRRSSVVEKAHERIMQDLCPHISQAAMEEDILTGRDGTGPDI